MSENNVNNQTQSNVRTHPEITELITTFYETVPGPVVGSFKRDSKTAEQCEALRQKIDEAKEIVETM